MNASISPNTQAILLLTAPLIANRNDSRDEQLLTPGEYRRVAQRLRNLGRSPSDLLQNHSTDLIASLSDIISTDRLHRLLGRGFLMSQAIERWQSRAIWVLSRADQDYPKRLKTRLRDDSPAVIYGCGEPALLDCGGLAVVGSRHVDESLVGYAKRAGQLCAEANKCVVSGGAQGIDRAAMWGALEVGGRVIGVLSDSLERAALNRANRDWLLNRNLVLISPYDPNAGFNVGHAMQRNKAIYALADLGLIVSAELENGGTWAGAAEQLQKLRLVPLFVRSSGEMGPGLEALNRMGARLWPDPRNPDEMLAILASPHAELNREQRQFVFKTQLPEVQHSEPVFDADSIRQASSAVESKGIRCENQDGDTSLAGESIERPAQELIDFVRNIILRLLLNPMSETEIANVLEISKPQARDWLQRLVDEGHLQKKSKPVRYAVRQKLL